MGAIDSRFAQTWISGVGNYVCAALGDDDLRGERVCALEFFAAECGGAGPGRGGVVGRSGSAGRWAGAAGSVAAADEGFFWTVVLGVELCRRHGGVARGVVPAEGWADYAG